MKCQQLNYNGVEQSLLTLLFATSTLIFVKLGAVSLSFPFGLLLLLYVAITTLGKLKVTSKSKWLLYFILVGIISSTTSSFGVDYATVYFWIQLFYWLFLSTYVSNVYTKVNWTIISRVLAVCTILIGILFLLVVPGLTQNGVSFLMVLAGPLGLYGIKKRILKIGYVFLLLALILLNTSRSGAIILFIQICGLLLLHNINKRKIIRLMWIVIVAIYIFMLPPIRSTVGEWVAPWSPDLSQLLINPHKTITEDKDWLQRRFQVQKGLQIFSNHPLLGIGYNNFIKEEVNNNLNVFTNIDANLLNIVEQGSHYRVSHNTYISILSETGILGSFFILIFFIGILKVFLKHLDQLKNTFEAYLFISFCGILIYYYSISGFYGTMEWLLFGMLTGAARKLSLSRRIK